MASQPAGVASQGPLVSVIIPFYNGEVYISEALDSALHQTYRNVEIIVVDDASTVDPKPRLASYGDRIFYIRRSSNGGVAASRNTGIRASHGEFIAFLDQDDLWLPERLARSVDELRNAPELGMVVTNTLIQDERRGVRTPHWRSITKTGERITKRLIRENFICTPGTMVRIDVLKAVGLFDEGYYGVDDFDLWYRIARVYDIGFIEEPLAVWRYHAESLSGNVARMLEDVLRFYDKVLELEEHEEELAVAKTRRREILFSLGVVQSLAHEDTAARETFKEVVNGGVPSLKAAVAIRLHAFSPGLFRVMRSLLGSGRPAWDQGIPTNLEVVV